MSNLEDIQKQITAVIIGDDAPAALRTVIASGPLGLDGSLRIHKHSRMDSLVGALLDRFPASVAFVGQEFLSACLRSYVHDTPPEAPMLHKYGLDFPSFFAGFEHAQRVPYVADLLALETAIYKSYQAVNCQSFAPSGRYSKTLANAQLRLAPHSFLVESTYPLLDLWKVGQHQLSVDDIDLAGYAQSVFVYRIKGDVQIEPVAQDAVDMLKSLSGDSSTLVGLSDYLRQRLGRYYDYPVFITPDRDCE